MQSTFAQNVRGHCRGRRFSVHSSDDDAALAAHDGSERLGPAPDRLSGIARAYEDRSVDLNGGGKDDELGVTRVLRAMFFTKTQTETLQSIRLQCADFIRTADLVPDL